MAGIGGHLLCFWDDICCRLLDLRFYTRKKGASQHPFFIPVFHKLQPQIE